MCNPQAAVMVASLVLANREAKSAERRQEQALAQAEHDSNVQASVEQDQIRGQAADELSLRARQALRERAMVRVATGEAGIAGNTAERRANEVDANRGFDIARIISNAGNRSVQAQQEQRGRAAGYRTQRASISRTSNLSTGLQIAGEYYKATE